MLDDVWWKIYKSHLINLKLKYKIIIGLMTLYIPAIIMLYIIIRVPSTANTVSALVFSSSMDLRLITIFSLGLLGIIPIYMAFVISGNISRQITELSYAVKEISRGNYDYKLEIEPSKDEVGELVDSVKGMVQNFTDSIKQVKEVSISIASNAEEMASSSEQMNAITEEVSSATQKISHGAHEQVMQLQTATEEMKNMARMIQSIAASSQAASEVATSSNQIAKEGGRAAGEAVLKMQEANDVVNRSSDAIQELGATTKQIGEIVNLITNIAEQTNLLALNAAIEAARAGEHGRGFAVVAEEVRKLAEGSSKAGKEITLLIDEILVNTNNAVESMELGVKEVNEATDVVDRALGALEEILVGVNELTGKVEEISKATQEQSSVAETVVNAIDEIAIAADAAAGGTEAASAATEEQSASMDEFTSMAQNMADVSSKLQVITSKFKIKMSSDEGSNGKE